LVDSPPQNGKVLPRKRACASKGLRMRQEYSHKKYQKSHAWGLGSPQAKLHAFEPIITLLDVHQAPMPTAH